MESHRIFFFRGGFQLLTILKLILYIFHGRKMFTNKTCIESTLEPILLIERGTAVSQWLRCCATNRKVVGSIPDGVIGIFH